MIMTFTQYLNEAAVATPKTAKHIPHISDFGMHTNTQHLEMVLSTLFLEGGKLKRVPATHDPKNKPKTDADSYILTTTKAKWLKLEAYAAKDPNNLKKVVKVSVDTSKEVGQYFSELVGRISDEAYEDGDMMVHVFKYNPVHRIEKSNPMFCVGEIAHMIFNYDN